MKKWKHFLTKLSSVVVLAALVAMPTQAAVRNGNMGGTRGSFGGMGAGGSVQQNGPMMQGSSFGNGDNQRQNQSGAHQRPQELIPSPQGMENLGNQTSSSSTADQLLRQLNLKTADITVDESYVQALGDVTQAEYDTFDDYLEQVDSNVLEQFEEDGWQLILTSEDLDQLLFKGRTSGVEGCTYPELKLVFVHTGDTSYCVIHEMAHYVDSAYNQLSETAEFQAIYEEEGSNLSEYGSTSASEFFAEVYMYAKLDEDAVQENCPKAYALVMEAVNNL